MNRHPHTITPGRRRRPAIVVAALLAGALGIAGSATSQSTVQKKRSVDERLDRAQDRLHRVKRRERVLTTQVAVYNDRVRAVETKLGPLETRLGNLEAERERLVAELAELNRRLVAEKKRLAAAEDLLARRRGALAERLRFIYDQGEIDPVLVLLQAGSLSEAVESDSVLQRITDRDGNLVTLTREHAEEVRISRDRIERDRNQVQRAEERTAQAAADVREVTTELNATRARLDKVRDARRSLLDSVQGDRRELEEHTESLRKQSAALAAKIVQAQAPTASGPTTVTRTPSSAGLIWPCSGTLTSGFGPRWGRMHEGIDIAVPSGTPVAAAASGTVIWAGWQGGYGNLVVVDHGGGIATAYGHNTSVTVSVGQHVGQGTIIAYSGSTGNSTGPHVHFEVRVNGSAVDPMGYL